MLSRLLLVLLLSAVMAQTVVNNYQERQVYYNEGDNVCRYGSGYDWVNILITLDGNAFNEVTIKTKTYCTQWGTNFATQIKTLPRWGYFQGDDYIKFEDQQISYQIEGNLLGIVVKTTVIPNAVLNGLQSTCVILGNGDILHFGGSTQFQPPTLNISCTTDKTQ